MTMRKTKSGSGFAPARGRMVAACRCAVEALEGRRLLSAGDPDLTFGAGGTASATFTRPDRYDFLMGATDVRNNLTVVAGTVAETYADQGIIAGQLLLARFTSGGQLDTSFSGDGKVTLNGVGAVRDVLVQPDNRILVLGSLVNSPLGAPAVLRFNGNGTLDTSFGGGDGIATLSLLEPSGIAAAPGGKYVVSGVQRSNFARTYAAQRLLSNGASDGSFGSGGVAVTNVTAGAGEVAGAQDVAVQADGKVVLTGPIAAGSTSGAPGSTPTDVGVIRLTAGGALDSSFGQGGRFAFNLGFTDDTGGSVEIAPGGKIVVGAHGGRVAGSNVHRGNLTALRLNANGTLDRKFATLAVDERAGVRAVRLATDGKVVVFATGSDDGLVARYNADGTLDRTFGSGAGFTRALGSVGDLTADNRIVTAHPPRVDGAPTPAVLQASRYQYAAGPNGSGISLASDGTLSVVGSSSADQITLRARPASPGGPENGVIEVVSRNASRLFFRRYAFSAVQRLRIDAGGGNDRVTLDAGAKPANVLGGSGNDTLFGGIGSNTMDGGDGDDTLIGSIAVDTLRGGRGNDGISGLGGNDTLFGGDGDDRLSGGDGDDRTFGEAGNDRFAGTDVGADLFSGGSGTDTADYSTAVAEDTAPLTITLDNLANDGKAGEGDNIQSDVEQVTGGNGNDTITGNSANNTLRGGRGNDRLTGGGGADALFGDDGDDTLLARDGVADFLSGGLGTDTGQKDANDNTIGVERFI